MKCLRCRELFHPDRRNHGRQKFCPMPDCRKVSKARSQARWLSKPANRDYFRGPSHRERVRQWRAQPSALTKIDPGVLMRSDPPEGECEGFPSQGGRRREQKPLAPEGRLRTRRTAEGQSCPFTNPPAALRYPVIRGASGPRTSSRDGDGTGQRVPLGPGAELRMALPAVRAVTAAAAPA